MYGRLGLAGSWGSADRFTRGKILIGKEKKIDVVYAGGFPGRMFGGSERKYILGDAGGGAGEPRARLGCRLVRNEAACAPSNPRGAAVLCPF